MFIKNNKMCPSSTFFAQGNLLVSSVFHGIIIGLLLASISCGHASHFLFTVSQDGTGTHSTISQAILAVPKDSPRTIFIKIKGGTYNEKVTVPKSKKNLCMIGDGVENTIVSYGASNKTNYNTSDTATFAVEANGFTAMRMSFENNAGPEGNQAVAFRSKGDKTVLYRCRIRGNQDTLYVQNNNQFYRECEVSGTIDFIFGHAKAVFQNCLIKFVEPMAHQTLVLAAQGRETLAEESGIVLHNCTLSRNSTKITEAYLGRPWRPYSTVVIMQSDMGSFVSPQGWLPWEGNNSSLSKAYFGEYKNRGLGSNTKNRIKCPGCKSLTLGEAQKFTVRNFIEGGKLIPSSIPYFMDLLP